MADKRQASLGPMGLTASLLGFFGVCLGGFPLLHPLAVALAMFGPLAIVLGLIGCVSTNRRSAIWAMVIGGIVSLYIPTLLLPFIAR